MNEPQSPDPGRHAVLMKRCTFLTLVLCAAGSGVLEAVAPEGSAGSAVIISLSYGVLLATWCLFDGRIRGRYPASVALMLIVMTNFFGFPIYCVWSRGLRGILYCLGFYAILMLSVIVGLSIAFVYGT